MSALKPNVGWSLYKQNVHSLAFSIWTNTFFDLDKYILQFEQMHFAIWTNVFFLHFEKLF